MKKEDIDKCKDLVRRLQIHYGFSIELVKSWEKKIDEKEDSKPKK